MVTSLSQSRSHRLDDAAGGLEARPDESFAEPREQASKIFEGSAVTIPHCQERRRNDRQAFHCRSAAISGLA